MEKASFILEKIKILEEQLKDFKDQPIYYLLNKQLFKLQKVAISLDKHEHLFESVLPVFEFIFEGIEKVFQNDEDFQLWLKESENHAKNIEDFIKKQGLHLDLKERLVELKHIIDEVYEIIEIVSGNIPN